MAVDLQTGPRPTSNTPCKHTPLPGQVCSACPPAGKAR